MGIRLDTFRSRVVAYATVDGQSYVTATADLNVLIDERLRSFTAKTKCLYSGAIKFTPSADRSVYPFSNPVAGSDFATTFQIDANQDGTYDTNVGLVGVVGAYWGSYFLNWYGYRRTTVRGAVERFAWPTNGSGTPFLWWESGKALVLNPAPTSAAITAATSGDSKILLSGWYQHPAILSATSDSTNLSIPDEHLEVAAAWCAIGVMRPYASGASLAKMNQMQAECAQAMSEIRAQSEREYDSGPRNAVQPSTVRLTN